MEVQPTSTMMFLGDQRAQLPVPRGLPVRFFSRAWLEVRLFSVCFWDIVRYPRTSSKISAHVPARTITVIRPYREGVE